MEGNFDIGSLTKDCTAILLPDDLDSDEESLKYIKSILKNYLKLSLKGWYIDKHFRPKNRSFA